MVSGVSGYSSYAYSSTGSSRSSSSSSSSATGCVGGPAQAQEKLFKLLDSNSDGSVDKDELTSALSKAQESDSSLSSIDIDDLFAQLDANSDGSISSDETAALAPPPPPGGHPDDLFASLDSDSNGSISQDELTTALGSGSGSDGLSTLFASLSKGDDNNSTASGGSDKNALYASLVQALMKQYDTGAGNTASSVGSQISIAA